MARKSTPSQRPSDNQSANRRASDKPTTGQQPPRRIRPNSKLENLKKEARRWLNALKANDEQARARLARSNPIAAAEPRLRDVQHALAWEHGFAGWAALKKQLEDLPATVTRPGSAVTGDELAKLADLFLEYATADPILNNGPAAHARRERAALRILNRYPQVARYNIHTAVVCGELEEVARILDETPDAAFEPGGPQRRRHLTEREKLWTPILHLCCGRLPLLKAGDNSGAILQLLLDHGADPNDFFEVGDHPCRHTTLCGVAGEGEDDAPPHPQRDVLARMLLEHGAEPYDIQVIYNIHFHGNILWFVKLMHEFAVKAGRQADWDDPEWTMINMGGYGTGARWHLEAAVKRNNLELAEWLLSHGANPNSGSGRAPRRPQRSLYEEAVRLGFTEIASLLQRYGARSVPLVLEGVEAFTDACFKLDRERAKALLSEHPEYLLSTRPIFEAARRDRDDVVALLLELGVPIEIEDDKKTRPLHEAASHDSLRVAKLLIERGAELEPVELNWQNTPLDGAIYGNLPRMIEYLSGLTRDVFRLTWIGNIERLREVLSEEPALAKAYDDGSTPLMWLPDDDRLAVEIVELLTGLGTDAAVRSKEGMTAADYAERRGLYDAAELLLSKAVATA
jgi:ankyrin repeat protein